MGGSGSKSKQESNVVETPGVTEKREAFISVPMSMYQSKTPDEWFEHFVNVQKIDWMTQEQIKYLLYLCCWQSFLGWWTVNVTI